MLLIENSDELEGTSKERNFFLSVRKFYVECVRKIIDKFPFSDNVIRDLGMLDPRNRHQISSAVVLRLLKRFNKQCSIEEMDTILKEWQEYKSLPDDQLPRCESLEYFWSHMGQLPMPAGEVGDKRFGNLANFSNLLLVLPHSTADPERLFSMIGKIDTKQSSPKYCL